MEASSKPESIQFYSFLSICVEIMAFGSKVKLHMFYGDPLLGTNAVITENITVSYNQKPISPSSAL